MTSPSLTVLGISGSLRRASFNTALLRAYGAAVPAPHSFVEADISDLPLYNDDVRLAGHPEPAVRFRRQLAEPTRWCSPRPNTTTQSPAC